MSKDFTEDDVAGDFADAIQNKVVDEVGGGSMFLRDYSWTDEDDEEFEWPFMVVRDGRQFEVDIDVSVTELTPERLAQRDEQALRLVAQLAAHEERKAAGK
jgi:hypothetical protein